MDTQLLTAFITVAETQSFSLAAKQLRLTQSAVSKRIALLEKDLSNILFDRIGRTVRLTEAGELLLPRAKTIIATVNDTKRFMEDRHHHIRGELRLATSHHIGIHRLPNILKHYTQQYPDVHLQLHFIDSEQASDAIARGEFDLAIVTLPQLADDDGSHQLQYHAIWSDPMSVVVNHQHPLQGKKKVSIEDLAQYPAILPDMASRTSQLVNRLFIDKGYKLNVAMTTNHLDAIKMMVNVGLGWSALPESLLDSSLCALSLEGELITRDLGCVHHRLRTLSNASRAMLHLLQNTATHIKQ